MFEVYKYRSIDLRRALASFSGRGVMTLYWLELVADTGPLQDTLTEPILHILACYR